MDPAFYLASLHAASASEHSKLGVQPFANCPRVPVGPAMHVC